MTLGSVWRRGWLGWVGTLALMGGCASKDASTGAPGGAAISGPSNGTPNAPSSAAGSSEADVCGGKATSDGDFIEFAPMFSAYDGVHTFKVPARVKGLKNVKWSACDPSMVDLDPSTDGASVTITTRKAGTVLIVAKSDKVTSTSLLTITQATPDDWKHGSERYNEGIVYEITMPTPGAPPPIPSKETSCKSCHANGGTDIEHTPTQIGGYSDEDLITIFTQGKKPAGVPQRLLPSAEIWGRFHKWEMTEPQRKGLVVYLRSLEPKSQGALDFMSMRRGARPATDGGAPPASPSPTPPTPPTGSP